MTERKTSDGAEKGGIKVTRRGFIKAGAAAGAVAGAGFAVSKLAFVRDVNAADPINVALIGGRRQGLVLTRAALKIKTPPIRFKALCDIWKYSQMYAGNTLKKSNHPVNIYADFREMLAKEKDLHAVLIATPDWMHAPQTIACLEAGLHVYCEKEMSNSLEQCRDMVLAARKAGKLLQIGHQRRSNPRYIRAYTGIAKKGILGRVTHCYGQWHRSKRTEANIPKKWIIDDSTLERYGYDTMERFRNWRWYRKYSGGAIADLGSHQVDIFGWFLGADPVSVIASGGLDYYEDKEWYDNVMATYVYDIPKGTARAFYQVLSTTSFGGFYEAFMGDKASLQISEDTKIGGFFFEPTKPKPEWVPVGENKVPVDPGHTLPANMTKEKLEAAEDAKKPVQQPHLENFFEAIRGKAKLTCPAEVAFRTAVPILKTNDAVASGNRVVLTEDDYKV
ncbi:MAG: Gfo/Idh/MocA family protein [Planctomycetota bacterium]